MSDPTRASRFGLGGAGRPSPLLKAESLTPLAEAESAAQAARAQAQRIIAEAQARARQIEAAAEAEGRKRAAALLAERAARSAADLQELSRHLPELVTSALRLLLEPAPPAELIARAAKRALQDFGSGAQLTLNVPAPLAEEVRERLNKLDKHHVVEVRGDPQAPHGSALLQTPWGDVELGIAQQVQALEAGLRAALEAPEPPAHLGGPQGADPFAAPHAESAPQARRRPEPEFEPDHEPAPQASAPAPAAPEGPAIGATIGASNGSGAPVMGRSFSLSTNFAANPGQGDIS